MDRIPACMEKERNASMSDLEFPFEYREGQRKIVSGVYHTISTERQIFVQAPTGVGKTMSTIFPAVRAVGAGLGKIFSILQQRPLPGLWLKKLSLY